MTPAALATARTGFDDGRLTELVLRYRARNFPETLSATEAEQWEQHRCSRLYDGEGGARTVDTLFGEIDHLSDTADATGQKILAALYDYVELIAPAHH